MPIDFYYSPASGPCRTVMLTAAALNLKMNMIRIEMREKDHLKPEYLKINPQHTVPTLVDDGFSLWESRTISRYLVNKYGGDNNSLYPEDLKARALIDQRLDFDMGTLYQRFVQYFYPLVLEGKPRDESAFQKLLEALGFLNTFLEGNKYAAGSNLTIADLALVTTISTVEVDDVNFSDFPNIAKWYDLVKATAPGYEENNQKGVDIYKSHVAHLKAKANK